MSFTGGRVDRGSSSGSGGDADGANINDNVKTKDSTWSSSKIGSELDDKANKTDLENHVKDSEVHVTSEEKEKLGNVEDGAEKNKVTSVDGKVGDVTIDTPKNISELNDDINVVTTSDKGVNNGVASLDNNGIIPISQLPAEIKQVKVVNNIEERDTIEELFEGLFVHVLDASDDEVTGGASYIYDGAIWHKVAESNELDAVLDWLNIENKPTEFKPSSHTHKADDIIEDGERRFVTDSEKTTWNAKSDFNGSYTDLTNKPSIPEKVSDLEDDIGIITDVSDKSDIGHEHDERYYTREEIDEMDFSSGDGNSGEFDGTVEWNNVSNKPQTYPPSEHNHDDRYNTKEDVQDIINFATEQMIQKQGKVKASEEDEADYLSSKIDGVTLTIQGSELKVKSVDGLAIGATDISSWLQGTEGNIQAQINELSTLLSTMSSGMSFKGTAENYAELSSYSNVGNGEVVVVLKDETKNDGRSMYIYSGNLGMWRYIGTFTFSTKFTALDDTPSGYEDGKYLKSTSSGIVYDDVDYQALKNKPQSTVTEIDDAVGKKHEHINKESLDSIGESASGALMYKGAEYVKKSDLIMPQKKFLYARRSGDQTLSSGSTCVFNTSIRGDIPYNSNTGLFTLEKGKFYRITVTASMKTEGFVILHVVDSTGNRPHSNTAIWTDLTRSYREASAGPLEIVFSPLETREYKVAVSSISGTSSLRSTYSALVVQEL